MKKMLIITAVSAALHVGSAAAAAGAGADVKQHNRLYQKGDVIITVGENAAGQVIANTQVQHAMKQLNEAVAQAQAQASASFSLQLPPMPM